MGAERGGVMTMDIMAALIALVLMLTVAAQLIDDRDDHRDEYDDGD